MKNVLLFVAISSIAVGLTFGGTITVSLPTSGNAVMASPLQIAWTASGVNSNVKILLRKPGGALVGTIAGNLPANASPYAWTVADPAVAGESYKIHVRAIDGSAEGTSAIFTISAPGGDAALDHAVKANPGLLRMGKPESQREVPAGAQLLFNIAIDPKIKYNLSQIGGKDIWTFYSFVSANKDLPHIHVKFTIESATCNETTTASLSAFKKGENRMVSFKCEAPSHSPIKIAMEADPLNEWKDVVKEDNLATMETPFLL
ncbi:MAG: GPI anchored serine-threonine rich family protein [Acidobacteria bacterium]|jgi:hypothetical protein|nr:GPI anchored serine-threonine rich family protein [Acidobacteriota bacterium]